MANKNRKWPKAQPEHVKTGKITPRKYAEKHPGKVEWVTVKKGKRG